LFEYDDAELTQPERQFADRMQRWHQTEDGYQSEQNTKPNSLAVGLGDSPAGLAAWILERLQAWSDCNGDLESVFGRADLLTWLSVYWVTGAIGTSFTPYALYPPLESTRIDVPTAGTVFPRYPIAGPREFAERFFDVRVWDEQPAGGHFGAWEQPEAFEAGVRSAVAPIR
jgi:pimeloyl-ACP methyl ester carboxylesterase